MKKQKQPITNAIDTLKATKPPLTKQQQLLAIAFSIQKQQEKAKANHHKLVLEKEQYLKTLAKELVVANINTLEIYSCENVYSCNATQQIIVKIPTNQQLTTLINEYNKLTDNYPRVRDLQIIITQLKEADRNTVNDNVITKILEDSELVKKLAEHGNNLINKQLNNSNYIIV